VPTAVDPRSARIAIALTAACDGVPVGAAPGALRTSRGHREPVDQLSPSDAARRAVETVENLARDIQIPRDWESTAFGLVTFRMSSMTMKAGMLW
jgi:hypothetical protein